MSAKHPVTAPQQPARRLIARFADGSELRADSYEELYKALANDWFAPEGDDALRRELARRIKLWSGTDIDKGGDREAFIRECIRGRLFTLVEVVS